MNIIDTEYDNTILDYFLPKMKNANEENEREDYNTLNPKISDIKSFIRDSYSSKEMVDIIRDLNYEDYVVIRMTENYINQFSDAKDYIETMYFSLEKLSEFELEHDIFEIINSCFNSEDFAEEIVQDMTEEELKNYI